MNYYTLIVDTTAYSGNFERQMTAFMTGEVGDCEVGDRFADMFKEEEYDFNFQSSIYQKMDDEHGIRRPCEIETTPGYVNNGRGVQRLADSDEAKSWDRTYPAYQSVAIYFTELPSNPMIAFLKERAHAFAKYYNKHGSYGSDLSISGKPSEEITIEHFRLTKTETVAKTEYI